MYLALFPRLILTLSYFRASDVETCLVGRLVLVAVCKELDVLSLLILSTGSRQLEDGVEQSLLIVKLPS